MHMQGGAQVKRLQHSLLYFPPSAERSQALQLSSHECTVFSIAVLCCRQILSSLQKCSIIIVLTCS